MNKTKKMNIWGSVKELFLLLSPNQRKKFYILQILVIFSAFFELGAITSVIPFIELIGNLNILHNENSLLAEVYIYSGVKSENTFVLILGFLVLGLLVVSSMLSILTLWRLAIFSNETGMELADRLYRRYMKEGWLFHTANSSAQLTKQIANEAERVTRLILQPMMSVNAKVVLTIVISVTIIVYNYKVAIVGITIFSLAYLIMYKVVRKRLSVNGKKVSRVLGERYQLLNEGFGGIKDTLLLGLSEEYIKRFSKTGKVYSGAQSINTSLSHAPRYIMELIAYGSMILLVIYFVQYQSNDIKNILPILIFYALTSLKLLPAFQQIYVGVTQIKGNLAAFNSIRQDLIKSKSNTEFFISENHVNKNLQDSIVLKNVDFSYPGNNKNVLHDISLKIKVNSVVGVVGSSGSGKSTLIDMILGLISPDSGNLIIDNEKINLNNLRSWQRNIGYVAQSVFLSDSTIAENVAYGIPKDKINQKQLLTALKLAHLTKVIESLEAGINTKVGERGVQLSGGQRQRIGIARALYHNANVLIFDEATSALDGITEKIIMDAVHDYTGHKTIIIIAHRLKTVKECDEIFFLENGSITHSGTYNELIEKNKKFSEMTRHV
jgi:ATP-binding cassette, subfamily B, bacterial PglK